MQEFKAKILENPNGHVDCNSTTIEDLANLYCSCWVPLQTLQAFIPLMNSMSDASKAILHGPFIGCSSNVSYEKLSSLEHWQAPSESLLIILNVTKDREQRTLVASSVIVGCHWSLLRFEIKTQEYTYYDTLGWAPPTNLQTAIRPIMLAFGKFMGTTFPPPVAVSRAHRATCNRARSTCSKDCLKNYPLQQCGNICGPITLLMTNFCFFFCFFYSNINIYNISYIKLYLSNYFTTLQVRYHGERKTMTTPWSI